MMDAYDNLLEDVCVRLGFCGSVDEFLPATGTISDEDFADALFQAEGWDLAGLDAQKFRSTVRDAFVRHMGRAAIDAGALSEIR